MATPLFKEGWVTVAQKFYCRACIYTVTRLEEWPYLWKWYHAGDIKDRRRLARDNANTYGNARPDKWQHIRDGSQLTKDAGMTTTVATVGANIAPRVRCIENRKSSMYSVLDLRISIWACRKWSCNVWWIKGDIGSKRTNAGREVRGTKTITAKLLWTNNDEAGSKTSSLVDEIQLDRP